MCRVSCSQKRAPRDSTSGTGRQPALHQTFPATALTALAGRQHLDQSRRMEWFGKEAAEPAWTIVGCRPGVLQHAPHHRHKLDVDVEVDVGADVHDVILYPTPVQIEEPHPDSRLGAREADADGNHPLCTAAVGACCTAAWRRGCSQCLPVSHALASHLAAGVSKRLC